MKKLFLFLLFALNSTSIVSAQEIVNFNGLNYMLNPIGLTATVVSSPSPAISGNIFIPSIIQVGATSYQVTALGDNCFYNCNQITSVMLPPTITSLGNNCFFNCTTLNSCSIPGVISNIGYNCFGNCSALIGIDIFGTFQSLLGVFSGCIHLVHITLPPTVINMIDTFQGCTSLTNVIIPPTVMSLQQAFGGCVSLTSLVIPPSVTDLGAAFAGCTQLTTLDIPSSVNNLKAAFYGCTKLSKLTCHWTTLSNVQTDANTFMNVPLSLDTLVVPNGTVNMYRAYSPWSSFGIIVDQDTYTSVQKITTDNRGILFTSAGGIITVSGLTDGETVTVYTIGGVTLGSANASAGHVNITVSTQDPVVIIKVGSESIKYAL